MTEIITLKNGNTVESGTWLDGAKGWRNSYRIIDIAEEYGMELDDDARAAVEWYRSTGDSDAGASDDDLTRLEIVTGQGGLSDRATEYMQELLPDGWTLLWDDGLSLVPAWEACSHAGAGCSMDWEWDANGEARPVVTYCADHKQEG